MCYHIGTRNELLTIIHTSINPMSPNLGPVPDNSTLVYYAVLTIVPSALPNITDMLSSIVLDGPPHNVIVSDLAVTTS